MRRALMLSATMMILLTGCASEPNNYNYRPAQPYNWGITPTTTYTQPQQTYHRTPGGGPPPGCRTPYFNSRTGSWTCADAAR